MRGHAGHSLRLIPVRIGLAQLCGRSHAQTRGDIAHQRIVRAGLVGHDVGPHPARDQLRQHLGRVAQQADGFRLPAGARLLGPCHGLFQVVGRHIEVAVLQPPFDAPRVHLDDERHALVHRDGQRLRAAHLAQAAVSTSLPLSEPQPSCRARLPNVSYVPCRMPCVPM